MLGNLAIRGGPPQFDELLHVGRPNLGRRDRLYERIDAMLDRNWLTNDGPLVRELEAEMAQLHSTIGAVAVSNATLGLQLVARAVNMHGEVLMPSFTFVATAHAVKWQGAEPDFVDIRPDDHNVDAIALEQMVTDSTGGIVGVHLWGRPCDVSALERTAAKHHLPLVFDAAHAVGVATGRGGPVGSGGLAEVVSLHATKFVNSFEGGVVLSNDEQLLDELRSLRNFGFAGYDEVSSIGTNAKMPEVCAAMGLTSLESRKEFTDANRTNYHTYRHEFSGAPGLRLVEYDDEGDWNYQYVVVEVDEATVRSSRDSIVAALHAENVVARRYFFPGCHRHAPYVDRRQEWALPTTERVAASVIVLPTGPALEPAMCAAVARLTVEASRTADPSTSSGRSGRTKSANASTA